MGARDGAFGFEPVGLLGGRVFAGAFRQMKIASAYNTNIFTGDVVHLVANGVIQRLTMEAAAMPIGIFMGVSYTDATLGFVQRSYWPAGQVAADAYGYICDDPDAVFKIQADATMAQTDVGLNAAVVNGSGSTATGKSGLELDAGGGTAPAVTATLPLRIVDFLERDEIDSLFPIMLVKWNNGSAPTASASGHQYNQALALDVT